ncbi:hypothetical protein P691DRAFT_703153 [Macrolepiota fuliginosa MF-IS2]|uniref:DUF6533 domain-containing protein n=1 Tax=Macrolepiota fuliginosa MF-IS2 TaxID=1400762 RepID=A0A9P5XH80_9AGAR|nr:hypothetical protein P691DRAFT_703153 [Macrolepiota fuliginosa MF-IS2]
MTPTEIEVMHATIRVMYLINAFNLASIAMLVYDYFLTLGQEVELIWKSRWNTVKFLFLLTRYLPFIGSGIILFYQFAPKATAYQCAIAFKCTAWTFIIGISIAELLLTIRTWAVWEKDRRLTIGLPIFFVSFWVTQYALVGLYLGTLTYEPSPYQPWVTCATFHMNRLLSVCWILLMIYDAGILILIVIQTLRTFRSWGNVPLTRVICQDGIAYFAYLFLLSFANIIIIMKLPREFVHLLTMIERVVHSVLTCRIILQIRQQDVRDWAQDLDDMDLKEILT